MTSWKPSLRGKDGAWNYAANHAEEIAAQARPGDLVYAPPAATSGVQPARKAAPKAAPQAPRWPEDVERRPQPPAPQPPDLAPLREALAARGLELVNEGAFFYSVLRGAAGVGHSGSTPRSGGASRYSPASRVAALPPTGSAPGRRDSRSFPAGVGSLSRR